MILLRRLPAPPELLARQTEWTERWKAGPSDWIVQTGRTLLQGMLPLLSHHKCAYCETELAGGLEIEHYHDKSSFPELAFDWNNLFPSCGKCNRTKGNWGHGGLLLKPDQDDGESFFFLDKENGSLEAHPSLTPADHSRAEQTIRRNDLNRGVLRRVRKTMFTTVQRYLRAIEKASPLPTELKLEFVELLGPAKPYKLAIRSALPQRLAEVDRRMYHAAD